MAAPIEGKLFIGKLRDLCRKVEISRRAFKNNEMQIVLIRYFGRSRLYN